MCSMHLFTHAAITSGKVFFDSLPVQALLLGHRHRGLPSIGH